jgi:hypothetical protein
MATVYVCASKAKPDARESPNINNHCLTDQGHHWPAATSPGGGDRASSVGSSLSLSTGKHGGGVGLGTTGTAGRSRYQRLAREPVPGPCLQAHLPTASTTYCAAVSTEAKMSQKNLHVS